MKNIVISYKIHRHRIGPVLINPCLGFVRPKKPRLKKKKKENCCCWDPIYVANSF